MRNAVWGLVCGMVIGWWLLVFQVMSGNCNVNNNGVKCSFPATDSKDAKP